ncbi:MAG: hypothetical protein ACKO2P_04450 [Planctomycetota bacterium]
MTLSSKTELLIQRCVDGELSASDTRLLLQQLDSIHNGWKSLACGLLEDRHLRHSFSTHSPTVAPVIPPDSPAIPPRLAPQPLSATRLRQWWNHPLTSLSLCAAIAFVGGLLVSGASPRNLPQTASSSSLPQGTSGFAVQLPGPAGTGQVPVYEDMQQLRRSSQNHPFFKESDSRQSMQVLVLPSADGRTIVIPLQKSGQASLQ